MVLMVLIDLSIALPAADKERLLNEVDVSNKIRPLRKEKKWYALSIIDVSLSVIAIDLAC